MKKAGFTIVELLIVVVVIAILAAISIVSYNGIVNRAKNVQFLSTVDAYEKSILHFQAMNGKLPTPIPAQPVAGYLGCLGEAPETEHIPAGFCATITSPSGSTEPYAPVNSSINTQLLEYISPLPDIPDRTMRYEESGYTTYMRGILYYVTSDGLTGHIYYAITETDSCGRGKKQSNTSVTPTTYICVTEIK